MKKARCVKFNLAKSCKAPPYTPSSSISLQSLLDKYSVPNKTAVAAVRLVPTKSKASP